VDAAERRTGGCLCGKVRYRVPSIPLATVICHCRNCQRQAGSAFSIVAVFQRDQLELEGHLRVYEDRGSSGQKVFRQFCESCGSPILTDTERAREQGVIFIKAGTFDEVSDLEPTTHYWTRRAHRWLPLPAGAALLDQE
jgi:hypothetical protein